MALTIRERRVPRLHISLDLPSCAGAFRYPNPPVAAPAASTSSAAARVGDQQLRSSDLDRVAVLGRGNSATVYKVANRRTSAVKIADFGIAKVLAHAGDHCTAYEGTAAYMSPERFDSERHTDPFAADVWSLGVTILELLMGRYPLLPAGQKPTWAALMCAICFGEMTSLPDDAASPELRAFLAACLHKDYTKRASVAHLLAHQFVAVTTNYALAIWIFGIHFELKGLGNGIMWSSLFSFTLEGRLLKNNVKIADFGIAKVLAHAGDHCTAYEGTAAYMSPERFDSERHTDPFAADVWSLGVTILELLMGRYPLLPAGQKPTWAALMCAICFGEMTSLPDDAASPELRAFLAACLHKDYTKRASVAHLLAHQFVAGRDVVASKLALRRLVTGA
uniref:mitogen-activated protein kinase kinase n=1 Tax=Oryza brachyantha TaxID=4533 RepID=J3LS65_ORYBR